jgi:hypothetical protein
MTVCSWLSPALSMTKFKDETMLVRPVAVPGCQERRIDIACSSSSGVLAFVDQAS